MNGHKKTWHVMPTKVIELGLQHSKKDSDFDRQVAFLLLDMGVETALKVFLMSKNDDDIEFIKFPDLIKRIKDNLNNKTQEIPLDKVKYFHGIRNKLHHQGDGVAPTKENLEEYGELAQLLLKILLDVNIDEIKKNNPFDSSKIIRQGIDDIQYNSGLLVEYIYPSLATRTIESQLRRIRSIAGTSDDGGSPSGKAELFRQRVEAFNKIAGLEVIDDDNEFMEYIIDHPEHLVVWLAFQAINSEDWNTNWDRYKEIASLANYEHISEIECKKIWQWTDKINAMVGQQVLEHNPDIETKSSALYLGWLFDDSSE